MSACSTIRRPPVTRSARVARAQSGYALLVVLLVFSLFVIGLSVAVPRWKTQIQRDRENESIDRAHQYVEGIKRYYHKFGSYPPNLARLKETNGIHYLRRAWPDPLTPGGKWQLLQFTDLKRGEVVGGALSMGGMGAAGASPLAGAANTGLGGGLGSMTGSSSLLGSSSGSTGIGGGAPGSSLFGDSGTGSDSSTGADSGTGADSSTGAPGTVPGATAASSGIPGSTASSSSSGSAGGLFGSKTGAAHGPVFGGSGIVGVASLNKKPGIHAFNRKHRPDQWQFVYNPMKDRSLLGPGVGNGPALGQTPGTNGFGGNTGTGGIGGGGGVSSGGGSGPGSGLFGGSSGPGQ